MDEGTHNTDRINHDYDDYYDYDYDDDDDDDDDYYYYWSDLFLLTAAMTIAICD